jgi:hypothetical protein
MPPAWHHADLGDSPCLFSRYPGRDRSRTAENVSYRFRRPLHNGSPTTGGSINGVGWRFQSFKINDLEMVAQIFPRWRLVTNPHELAQWSGTKLVEGPARAVSAGDRLVFRAGMLHIIFDVLDMETPRQLRLDIALPFGVKNREQIQITPIDANSCRTTFN